MATSYGKNQNPSNDQEVIGYEKAAFLAKIQKISYWRQRLAPYNAIDPALSPRVNPALWNRSLSARYRLSGNNFVWGPITELENIPVANTPNSWSQQYIQVQVNGSSYTQLAQSLRHVPSVNPLAYNQPSVPSNPLRVVMALQKSQLAAINNQANSGSNFMTWLRSLWTGGGSNV